MMLAKIGVGAVIPEPLRNRTRSGRPVAVRGDFRRRRGASAYACQVGGSRTADGQAGAKFENGVLAERPETVEGDHPSPEPQALTSARRRPPAGCQLRWRVLRAVVQSVTIACCACARVILPEQTAVCSFVSTGSFRLLTPEPARWPGSAGSSHRLR